jgi:hypothetical protein
MGFAPSCILWPPAVGPTAFGRSAPERRRGYGEMLLWANGGRWREAPACLEAEC